jgi:hypothetical protein
MVGNQRWAAAARGEGRRHHVLGNDGGHGRWCCCCGAVVVVAFVGSEAEWRGMQTRALAACQTCVKKSAVVREEARSNDVELVRRGLQLWQRRVKETEKGRWGRYCL